MPPISTCCDIRDPDTDRHRCGCGDEITDRMAEGAVAAAEHLRALGTPGIFSVDLCRAMWRSGHHRIAAETFSFSSGGEAA